VGLDRRVAALLAMTTPLRRAEGYSEEVLADVFTLNAERFVASLRR